MNNINKKKTIKFDNENIYKYLFCFVPLASNLLPTSKIPYIRVHLNYKLYYI